MKSREPQSTWRKPLALWPAAFLCAATAERALADGATSHLDHVMADYVFNFTKFVEWPQSSHPEQLVICVAGNTGLYNALLAEAGTTYSRHVSVRKIEDAHSVAGCHVLYIESASSVHITELEKGPTLTVGDGNGFAHAGGTIELFTQHNRLRFIINLDNARRAGLHISANLLQLAASVEGGEAK